MENNIDLLIATAQAHRPVHSAEHTPSTGKLHGYCIVCGVSWPCDTANVFLNAAINAKELAATVPAVAAANIQSAAIAQIAAEIERGAGLVASTDPDVVQCSMLNWARQLRAL
jgi:hypothetical protein